MIAVTALLLCGMLPLEAGAVEQVKASPVVRRLYVAVPGIRNYLEYGGHGLLVYDIDHGHRLIKRIPTAGLNAKGEPNNVKGICASSATKRIYISTIEQLMCLDLVSEKLLWERSYEGGCDRMSITPGGHLLFVPSLEKAFWNVVRGDDGQTVARIVTNSASHNTIIGLRGDEAYLAGLHSPHLVVVSTATNEILRTVGPFASSIRPFTVNGRQSLCFVNVNDLLGFEVGDLKTGRKRYHVEVAGFEKGPTKRHGCPSHGIGLTPDESEIWLTDAQQPDPHLRRHRDAPAPGRQYRCEGPARLDHVLDRRPVRLPVNRRRDRCQVSQDRSRAQGRDGPSRPERETHGDRFSRCRAGADWRSVRHRPGDRQPTKVMQAKGP